MSVRDKWIDKHFPADRWSLYQRNLARGIWDAAIKEMQPKLDEAIEMAIHYSKAIENPGTAVAEKFLKGLDNEK